MSRYYDTAPMRGTFLVSLHRRDQYFSFQKGFVADSPEDLAVKVAEYADQHGLVVEGATFADRPVPGIGDAR